MRVGLIPVIFRKAQNKIQDPDKLRRLIDLIDGETWTGLGIDVKGDIYEGLLEKNAQDTKSGAGQYFEVNDARHFMERLGQSSGRSSRHVGIHCG